ncbi:MAG: restriction endonuclease [Nitrospinae bacterium]|nr:restriction endonuclease [Nitrospinota bacterium]
MERQTNIESAPENGGKVINTPVDGAQSTMREGKVKMNMDRKNKFDSLLIDLFKIKNKTQLGKTFENLCEYYLKGRFQYLWGSSSKPPNSIPITIPDNIDITRGDTGVDYYACGENGEVWAIQVKARKNKLVKGDLNSFIADTTIRKINKLMVVTTSNGLSSNATKYVAERQITMVFGNDLRDSNTNWPESLRIDPIIAPQRKPQKGSKWLPFAVARQYAQALRLRNHRAWLTFVRSGHKREDVPANPQETYGKKKEWTSWGDFLGTGNIRSGKWLCYEDARQTVLKLGLKNDRDWREWSKSGKRPKNIPANPDQIYAHKGWCSWPHWLRNAENKSFVDFEAAREFARSSDINKAAEWNKIAKSGSLPANIPRSPRTVYLHKGWKGWGDFLGSGATSPAQPKNFVCYEEASQFAQSHKVKSASKWRILCQSGDRPTNIPANPSKVYKNDWTNWGKFLGKDPTRRDLKLKWLPFNEARKKVWEMGMMSREQWRRERHNLPEGIPRSPEDAYNNQGWKGWGDWLGFRRPK